MIIHLSNKWNKDILSLFRAVYYPSKVLSQISDLPNVVKGKIVAGKPSTIVVLKNLQLGKLLRKWKY